MISKSFSEYVLRFDGACKGNPGLAGAGAVIYLSKEKEEIYWSGYQFIGEHATNNIAEYEGLLLGLKYAIEKGITHLRVEGDSLLVIKQMKGEWKVSAKHLREYHQAAKDLEQLFLSITYEHIYRNRNQLADEFANQAIVEFQNSNK